MLDWLKKTFLPIGERIAGGIKHIGSKISQIGNGALDFVEGIPLLGAVAKPITSVARAGLGVVDGITNVAGAAQRFAKNPSTEGFTDVINAGLGVKAPAVGFAGAVKSSGLLRKR